MLRVEIFRAQSLQNALVAASAAAQGDDSTTKTNNEPMTTVMVAAAPPSLSLCSDFGNTTGDTSHDAATSANESTTNKTTTTIYADETHYINLWTAYQDYKSGHVWPLQKQQNDDNNSSNHNIILGMGRKNAMITFEEDKSVSRTHAEVKLIVNPTKLKSLQQPVVASTSDEGGADNANNKVTQEDIEQIQTMFGPQNETEQTMFQRKSEEEAERHDNSDNVHDEKSSLSHENCFVLAIEDIGSKFGTFVLEPLVFDASTASSSTAAKPTNNNPSDDDDETTDDEQMNNHTAPVGTQPSSIHLHNTGGRIVVPTSSMYVTDAGIPHTPTPQAISSAEMLSKLFFQNETNKNSVVETTASSSPLYYKQTQLTPKNSSPLYLPLWNNNGNEQSFGSSNRPKSVLLQLGVYGSCIRLTHIPLVMCASGLSKEETTTTIPRLLQFGLGTCDFHPTTWNNSTNTHLITNEVRPTGKNLAAWLLDKSIVKPIYIQKLMIDRSSCKQPLPTLQEYEAPLSESGSKGGMVRHLSIEDRQQKRSKLKNAIVIGTHPKEHAELLSLCDAMGASAIVPAYDFIDDILEKQQGKNDEWLFHFLQTHSKEVSNEEQQRYDGKMILALEVMTKKHTKKLKSLLKVVSSIKSIRFVKCASIGEYVVKSDGNLVDTNGEDITERVRRVRNEKEDDTTPKEATSKIKNEASPATNDHKEKEKSPDQLEEENDILVVGGGGGGGDEAEDSSNVISIADKDAQGGGPNDADVENVPSSTTNTTRKKRLAATSSEESKHNDDGVSSKVSNKKRKVRLNDEQPIKKERTRHHDEYGDEGNGRKSLVTTNDGWMVAAPSDRRQRQAYKRRLEDMDIDDATLFRRHGDAILTETMPQPEVVRQRTSKNHKNKSVNQKFTSKKRGGGGPNFKAFKKNFVPLATEDTSNITFDIVLPKETERQRQLLLTQKELERQEQQADALFQAVPSGASQKAGGRRRRTGR